MPRPDLPQSVEQHARFGDGQEGAAELAVARPVGAARIDLPAELLAHPLLAIADAEDRQAAVENRLPRARAARCGDRGGRARQDHPLWLPTFDRGLGPAAREEFPLAT